jgi:hypothetical protein
MNCEILNGNCVIFLMKYLILKMKSKLLDIYILELLTNSLTKVL